MFSGVPNNNSNTKLNHYVVYRSNDNVVQSNSLYSLLYIENKYTSINPGKKNIQSNFHLSKCNRNASSQNVPFSFSVLKKLTITGMLVLKSMIM